MSSSQSQEERDRSLEEIKSLVKENINGVNIRVLDNPKGLMFSTNYGKILIPNEAIDYYYTIFNDTIQKIRKYEGYIDKIDNILNEKNPTELTVELKELINWFNFSEIFSENYSVVSQWLADNDISKEMLSKMYKSYSTESIEGLDESMLNKYVHSVKKSLSYYSILLKMFEIFDETIFNR